MSLRLVPTSQIKKDYKRAKRRGLDWHRGSGAASAERRHRFDRMPVPV